MISRILSVAAPLFVYFSLALLAAGLIRERKNLEWPGLIPAALALIATFAFVAPVHQLFFDEDIYIHIASNLTHAPVARLTLIGTSPDSEVFTYYKSGAGFPVLLSLVFLLTGPSETGAHVVARVFFALLASAVYFLARKMGLERPRAAIAAATVAVVPVCLRYSVSAGTDVPAAVFATIGMWGIAASNGLLAVAGLALAAQTRLELVAMIPLLLFMQADRRKWAILGLASVSAALLHSVWVLSAAPEFAAFERVESAFAVGHLLTNLKANAVYFFDAFRFPVLVPAFAAAAFVKYRKLPMAAWFGLLFTIYLFFYAGSFAMTPRYSIQIVVPLVVLAFTVARHRYALAAVVVSALIAGWNWSSGPEYVPALISDHAIAVDLAARMQPGDVVITTEPEIFMNHGKHAVNGYYAAARELPLDRLRHYKRILYYAGAQTNVVNSPEWGVDRWIKSRYELRLLESKTIQQIWIGFFEVSAKPNHRVGEQLPRP